MCLVAHPTEKVSGLVHPGYFYGIFAGLIHSKNWGELTHLRFLGSSPPPSGSQNLWRVGGIPAWEWDVSNII